MRSRTVEELVSLKRTEAGLHAFMSVAGDVQMDGAERLRMVARGGYGLQFSMRPLPKVTRSGMLREEGVLRSGGCVKPRLVDGPDQGESARVVWSRPNQRLAVIQGGAFRQVSSSPNCL